MVKVGEKVYDYRHAIWWCATMLTLLVTLRVLSMMGVGA